MSNTTITIQQLYEQIRDLPQESLPELARYIEFLRFKARTAPTTAQRPLRIIKLGGLLKGYDFSPELLAEVRQEMWQKLEAVQS